MDAGLIAMRMRLSGGKEVAAEAETATAAVEETEAATAKANKKASSLGNGIRSSLTKQITAMRTIGRGLTKYVALPLAAIAIGSGVMAAHFDRSMNLIATDAGGSVKEVSKLKSEVLDLARNSQYSPQNLADSLFHVESSGYRGAKAMRVLNEAQKLATAGNSDLESTTYALVSATKALNSGDSLKGVTKVAAQLNEIVSHGDIRLEELTSAMSTGLIPTAKALGLSVADVGSALDVMTKRGIPAQRAAYALNFTLQKLIPSTDKAKEAFAALGIGEEQLLRTAQKKGLPAALALLKSKLDGLTKGKQIQVIDEMFGGGRMSKGLLVAIQHVGEMRELWGQVDGNVALYKKHIKEAEEQPLVKAKAAWSSIEASLIELGNVILPAVIPLMEHLAGFIGGIATGFAHLPHATQEWVVAIAGIAAVLGPILLLTAKLLEMWKSIKELQLVSAIGGGLGELGAAGGLAMGGELGGFGMMSAKGRFATGAVGAIGSQVAGHAIGGRGGELVSNIGTGAFGGFAVGGPMGAAVGATAGAIATALPEWKELLGLQKKLAPIQIRLSAAGKDVATTTRKQAEATHGLAAAEQRTSNMRKRQHTAISQTSKALFHLNLVTGLYGPKSRPAIRAAAQYTEKLHAQRRAIERLKNAERLRGIALSAYKTETNFKVLAERHEINLLQVHAAELRKLYQREAELHPTSEKTRNLAHSLLNTENELAKEVKNHADTMGQAAAKAGPKYAQFLQHSSQETLRFGGALKAASAHAQAFTTNLEHLAEAKLGAEEGGGIIGQPRHGGRQHPGAAGGHHRKTANDRPGSSGLETLMRRGGKQVVHHQPVVFEVDKRTLAEGSVEITETEDARA